MLSFAVYANGQPAERVDLAGSYLIGSDDVPLRAEISVKSGKITCKKRAAGPAGLAMLWNLPGVGSFLLETVRLLERPQPYLLQVELARGRLLRINQKLEDWGLINYEGAQDIQAKVTAARELLIQALQADTLAQSADKGDKSLAQAVMASEELTLFHAEALLQRRRQSGGFPKRVFGCTIPLEAPSEPCVKRLSGNFDFVTVPFNWKEIEPKEQMFNWKPVDAWIDALVKAKIPIRGSSLLSFHERNVPDWLYTWEQDFDTLRDLAFEHARRIINRYGQYIQTWEIISGIHANTCFAFNFEQLMELSRMTAALAKQASPRSTSIITLVAPWGEYYARNQRTIPPMLYADMVAQSVNFDAFGLQFQFGPAVEGMFVRDMFQISSLLDQFTKMSKPVHVTVQVPSDGKGVSTESGGNWHGPWSEPIQAEWVKQFTQVALSKPFVDTVCWHFVADHERQPVPHGGLLRSDYAPKPAFQQFVKLRTELSGPAR